MDLRMLLLLYSFTFGVAWCADEMKMKIKGALTATGTMDNFANDSNMTVHIVTEIKNMLNGMCEYGEKNENLIKMSDKIDKIHSDMQSMTGKLNTIETLVREIRKEDKNLPRECNDGKSSKWNGEYRISPDGYTIFNVKCETGGWTVIQKRFNGKTDFNRNWNAYENGFGDLNGEFWLGNRHIALITSYGTHELRIDLEDWKGNKVYALYKNFKVGDATTKYKLTVSGYSGNAGDSLSDEHNGQYFSTYDQDNDKSSSNCASHKSTKGAWWYNGCYHSSLNGSYTTQSSYAGIKWYHWKKNWSTLKKSTMSIRKV